MSSSRYHVMVCHQRRIKNVSDHVTKAQIRHFLAQCHNDEIGTARYDREAEVSGVGFLMIYLARVCVRVYV